MMLDINIPIVSLLGVKIPIVALSTEEKKRPPFWNVDNILLEDSNNFLLEDNSAILLE